VKLEGIRVVDLSLFLPGPLATQFMADHGAEVVKIESLHEGEPNRNIGATRDGVSVYFANTHRGKKSLALNLKDPAGVEVLMRLAERSDVLVEAFRPGVVIAWASATARWRHAPPASSTRRSPPSARADPIATSRRTTSPPRR
jgi:crotonobetainyl-CoA:carnitine CoA-transferase CaiB-like acyl-CoA transferase